MRNLTKDVVSVVTSQGQISGQVFRVLLRKHVRHELQTAALERVARKMGGTAAAGSACDEKPPADAAAAAPEAQAPPADEFHLPSQGVWELTCEELDPYVIEEDWNSTWLLVIDFGRRTFRGSIDGTMHDLTYYYPLDWHWTESASGEVTEDGYLRGTGNYKTTIAHPHTTVVNTDRPIAWTGAIATDLSHVCIARTLPVDLWLTPDWIRQAGREAFMRVDGGCRGLCVVTP